MEDDPNLNQSNEKDLWEKFEQTQPRPLSVQMEDVRKIISHFKDDIDVSVYERFVKHFPRELHEEFRRVSEADANEEGYKEKKQLFFEVFEFIFSKDYLIYNTKAIKFIEIMLKFIKTKDKSPIFEESSLLYRIMDCIVNEQNKVLFINENGLFHFFSYFHPSKMGLEITLLEVCETTYQLQPEYSSLLCHEKISDNLNQLMVKYRITRIAFVAIIVIIIFMMLYRLKMLDQIEFSIMSFYDVTSLLSTRYVYMKPFYVSIYHLAKIWTGIFNGSKKIFQIDNLNQLSLFSMIYAIDLSKKLLSEGGQITFTKSKKFRMCILYLALIAFPIISRRSNVLLPIELKKFHMALKSYIQIHSIDTHSVEDQFLILHYIIKSHVTLNFRTLSEDDEAVYVLVGNFSRYNYQNIHPSYIISHLLLSISQISSFFQSEKAMPEQELQEFMSSLISGLSDETYIQKLREPPHLFEVEDLKSTLLSVINVDFIKDLFTKCETYLFNDFQKKPPMSKINTKEYKTYKQVMSWIIDSIDENKKLDDPDKEYYSSLCKIESSDASKIQSNPDSLVGVLDSTTSQKITQLLVPNAFEVLPADL
ncbi:hypothetical protein RF11_06223 [Thelohanellus kitauei]|uniref:Uncharacterized protein n=1 Tax=Thelohanellus kitauei TaxID=669202 RepID=A0A0C2J3P4_THEKT|nr:hypothetical protein RF11_06223 [Thelohanellus kitauei]